MLGTQDAGEGEEEWTPEKVRSGVEKRGGGIEGRRYRPPKNQGRASGAGSDP